MCMSENGSHLKSKPHAVAEVQAGWLKNPNTVHHFFVIYHLIHKTYSKQSHIKRFVFNLPCECGESIKKDEEEKRNTVTVSGIETPMAFREMFERRHQAKIKRIQLTIWNVHQYVQLLIKTHTLLDPELHLSLLYYFIFTFLISIIVGA